MYNMMVITEDTKIQNFCPIKNNYQKTNSSSNIREKNITKTLAIITEENQR